MRKLPKPWLVAVLTTTLITIVFILPYIAEPYASKSPQLDNQNQSCIGSGHTFGENIHYEIKTPAMCEGEEYRIIKSKNESDVEIWSKDEKILNAPLGSSVILTDNGFQIVTY